LDIAVAVESAQAATIDPGRDYRMLGASPSGMPTHADAIQEFPASAVVGVIERIREA
jgi:hypothetical protein